MIATTRTTSDELFSELQSTEYRGPGSKLIHLLLDITADKTTYETLAYVLTNAYKIEHIDYVIVNAGASVPYKPVLETTEEDILNAITVNTLSIIKLFKALYSHMTFMPPKLSRSQPKFVFITSILGSIGSADSTPYLAYGLSKNAGNYLIKKIHLEHGDVVTLALHPGWVRTTMGEGYRGALEEAIGFTGSVPLGVEESVKGMLDVVSRVHNQSRTCMR